MTTSQNLDRLFVLEDTLTGKFRPELLTWEAAKAAAAEDGFVAIRRADEVVR